MTTGRPRHRLELRLSEEERAAIDTLAQIEGDPSASALVRRLVWVALRDSGLPGPWQNASRGRMPRYDGLADSALDRELSTGSTVAKRHGSSGKRRTGKR